MSDERWRNGRIEGDTLDWFDGARQDGKALSKPIGFKLPMD